MQELSRLNSFRAALWADLKTTRGWKIVTVLYLLSGIAAFVRQFFTQWTPALLLSSWSGKAKWIFFLVYLCVGLILLLVAVVDGTRRLYMKAVGKLDVQLADAKADFESRARNIENLSEVYGRAYQLNRQFSPEVERPTPGALQHLAERLRKALWVSYGMGGTEKFTEGKNYYSVTVPEDKSKHSEWVYNTYLRLGDLIKEESPKQERLIP